MKKLLLSATALASLSGFPALAADLPARTYTKAPAMIVSPVYTWTGFYVGVNAGGVWSNSDIEWAGSNAPGTIGTGLATAQTGDLKLSGFTGGGQAGYNYQVSNWVWGIEADINYTGLRGTRLTHPAAPFVNTEFTNVESRWLSTVRGRAGIAIDRWYLYATGGLAVANVSYFDSAGVAFPFTNGSNTTRVGWTAGAGVEWAFNQNWSVKAEYLYVDLGSVSYNGLTNPTFGTLTGLINHNLTENIGRLGINYRFGGPVVARY
jgi:outer membrane immunogenic protein